MARPAHIAALDAALDKRMDELRAAEVEMRRVLDANIAEYDRISGVVDGATKPQMNAFYDARMIEEAIRKLGYVVLDGPRAVGKDKSRLDGHTVNRAAEIDAARARVAEPGDPHPGGASWGSP